jgi:hypothetical protein
MTRAHAHLVWITVSSIGAAAIVLQAGSIAKICYGRATYAGGILMLIIAFSHLFYRSIRVSNMSLMVGALIGWAVLELFRRDGPRGGAAIALSTIIKYFGAILAPLALATGRWKTIVWSSIWTAVLFGVTALISGTAVFREYFTTIAPRLGRSLENLGNQSIEGFMVRVFKSEPLEPLDRIVLHTCSAIVLICVLIAIFAKRKSLLQDPPRFFAAAAALLLWMMLFAPICWTHYLANVIPLWGWLAWEFGQGWIRRTLVIAIIAMSIVLSSSVPGLYLKEPINSHPMYAMMLTMGLAIARLLHTPDDVSRSETTDETAQLAATSPAV